MYDEFKQVAALLPQRTGCLSSPSVSDRGPQVLGRARMLLGCYRTGDAADPETYVAAIAAVLSEYPMDVVELVTDPRTGLPSRSTWLPTVAEVRQAADAEIDFRSRQERRRAADDEVLRLRKLDEQERERRFRPTIDELKAKYGFNWGLQSTADDEAQREAARAKMRAAAARTNAEIAAEWGEQRPPTIAGIPISKSLANALDKTR